MMKWLIMTHQVTRRSCSSPSSRGSRCKCERAGRCLHATSARCGAAQGCSAGCELHLFTPPAVIRCGAAQGCSRRGRALVRRVMSY